MMKNFIAAGILCMAVKGYPQTANKSEPYSNAWLNQYLWSYSKNSIKSGEKPLIDFDAINNWRMLGSYLSVSNDGNYFAYTINRRTPNPTWFSRVDSLLVQSTTSNWRMSFPKVGSGFFTEDSKQYVFKNGTSLFFLQLGMNVSKEVKDVTSYKTNKKNDWLAWKVKNSDSLMLKNLVSGTDHSFTGISDYNFHGDRDYFVCHSNNSELLLLNLQTNEEKRFSNVAAYSFSGNGNALLLKTLNGTNASLQFVTLPQGRVTTIYATKEKESIGNYSLDDAGRQVVFIMTDSLNPGKSVLWYYKAGGDKAVLKLNNDAPGIPEGQAISEGVAFTDNGKYVQFSIQAPVVPKATPSEEMPGVEVWNYKDVNLQSAQVNHVHDVAIYRAIAEIETGKVVFCESSNKKLVQWKGDYAVVRTDYENELGDRFWESKLYKDSVWIVSLKEGRKQLLPASAANRSWFSPDGNWFVYFNAREGCHYYSYNLHTGQIRDITGTVANNQLAIDYADNNAQGARYGNLAAWIDGSTFVLVYDSYDIWKLDLTGRQPAVNITNGFGRANNTILNLFATDHQSSDIPTIKANDGLVLRAFNRSSKQNGFYKKANLDAAAPTVLYMGSYFMSLIAGCHDLNLSNDGMLPMKAKNNKVWIVQRQSATDAPNYYQTTDFKNFRRLTNLQPQAQYKWLIQELHSFKHLDGATGQGILYKPQDFDSTRKYPVLIAFYGDFSNNMYQFCTPNYLAQSIAVGRSPIWLLNNGFLVFTPDIAVAPLKYGPKAYSTIEGAVKYLQQLPFVDANKLGFATHSWSSQLGAYLFTHSTTFDAAAITEGLSFGDVISQALSLKGGQGSLQTVEEGRSAGNLWENKTAWLDQTTVLNVDKAKAALLLLCNKESSQDYQDQATQFFIAMRRLNKSAWWLKYDNGSHTLIQAKELKDYTLRYTQFFDHYLHNAPAPLWMTQGIPYKLKGVESRYELDPQGKCNATNGEPCTICEAWNKQYARTPEMFKKEIKDWTLEKDIAEELERKQNERRKELDKLGEIQTKQVLEMLKK